jgi:hypothetical protein
MLVTATSVALLTEYVALADVLTVISFGELLF